MNGSVGRSGVSMRAKAERASAVGDEVTVKDCSSRRSASTGRGGKERGPVRGSALRHGEPKRSQASLMLLLLLSWQRRRSHAHRRLSS